MCVELHKNKAYLPSPGLGLGLDLDSSLLEAGPGSWTWIWICGPGHVPRYDTTSCNFIGPARHSGYACSTLAIGCATVQQQLGGCGYHFTTPCRYIPGVYPITPCGYSPVPLHSRTSNIMRLCSVANSRAHTTPVLLLLGHGAFLCSLAC